MKNLLSILILVVLFIACQSEPKINLGSDNLRGHWDIIEAYRDGRETHTLEKGYFEFLDSNTFRTNIFKDTTLYAYTIEDQTVSVNGPSPMKYNVSNLISDTLIMVTEIRKFEFILISVKKPDNESE